MPAPTAVPTTEPPRPGSDRGKNFDGEASAAEIGLSYVLSDTRGYRRRRRGKGFSYEGTNGKPLSDRERERIKALAIPPAWSEVWIAADSAGHIQATGQDGAGRKQYIYHPRWVEMTDEIKFDRMAEFGRLIPKLRRAVDSDLRRSGFPRERVVALAVAVLDRTLIRVGNQRYVDLNKSYGLTTLTDEHVEVEGFHVHLEFEGKGGADHQLVFRDRRLASLIARCRETGGDTLFTYETSQGQSAVTAADVNSYLADTMKGEFTAKDFRTWGATALVTGHLARSSDSSEEAVLEAVDLAAERLGNTRAVCRTSYLHPAIPDAFLDGSMKAAWQSSRTGRWMDRAESTVNRLLVPDPRGRKE